MRIRSTWRAAIAAGLLLSFNVMPAQASAATDAIADVPVTIICEHGSVKSLIAASLFNEAARTRGLPYRAVSRGVTPDESVPPKIVSALREEGVDVAGYRPRVLSEQDVTQAAYVVTIGVDVPAAKAHAIRFEQWDDVPPASVDYKASRDSLRAHVDALLDRLEKSK